MKVVLLVTWIVSLQPPSSYHVEFDSLEKCEAAKLAVLDNREQMVKAMGAVIGSGTHLLMVTAVCAPG